MEENIGIIQLTKWLILQWRMSLSISFLSPCSLCLLILCLLFFLSPLSLSLSLFSFFAIGYDPGSLYLRWRRHTRSCSNWQTSKRPVLLVSCPCSCLRNDTLHCRRTISWKCGVTKQSRSFRLISGGKTRLLLQWHVDLQIYRVWISAEIQTIIQVSFHVTWSCCRKKARRL